MKRTSCRRRIACDANTTTFGYDALGRQTTSVDPRTGTTTTAYVSGTSQVYTVTDPASIVQATYAYDSAGRVSSVKDALNKYAYTSYTDRNEVYRQWGDTAIPVEYGYDNWGHRVTMKTYRGGSGWTGSTWPASPGTADTTTWAFQERTGLLSSKTDAAGKAVSYTYTQARQIDTRQWARILTGTTHVTTAYSYSSTTGELTSVDYNDATTDLGYTYNRLGNMATVADVTGTRTFNYNLAGTLELQSEDLPSFFSSKRISYPYSTSGIIGRPTGLQLGTSGSPTADQSITYGYDSSWRMNSFTGGGQTFAYAYATNSSLVATVTHSGANYTDTRTYDPYHDWVDDRKTQISSAIKAEFAYAQDNIGRTTNVARTGEVFSRYGNGTEGLKAYYGYDDRSQVTSEVTKVGATATVLTGRDDAFAYDTMGNRASSAGTSHNGNAAGYTTNALNQYTQRTVPGIFDVAGAAATSATVTMNGSSTGVTRQGEYFFKGQAMSNNPNPAYSVLAVSDGTTTANLPAFVAGTPEAMAYDDDGNLTSDGRWDYTYDAENRLISVQTHTALSPSPLPNADARRLEFKNDYLGRRVEKLVRSGWNGSTFTTVASDEKFVANGWNVMARLNAAASNATLAAYYWGMDIAGAGQAAGGVGGLLMIQDSGNSYLPAYDGNGNIYGLIKASDGSLAAAYEYDAFGQTLRESGTYAASNPFRFSTKFTDLESCLVYYGLRYYSPTLGRFINKDPIEERGGLNLYGFCGNNGVNGWDNLGMTVSRGRYDVLLDGGVDPRMSGGGSAATLDWAFSTGLAVVKDEMDSVMNSAHPSATNSGNWYQNMLAREQEKAIKDALVTASGGSMSSTQAGKLSEVIMQYGWDAVIATATIANQASSPTTPAKNDVPTATTTPGRTIDLTFGFEQGVSDKSVAETQAQAFQALLNKYTNLTGEPSVVIQSHYSANPVDHPRSGVWSTLASDEPYNAIAAYTPAGGFGVLIASSVMKNEKGDIIAGFASLNTPAAVISFSAQPTALAHEYGHYIGWRGMAYPEDPVHAAVTNNVMASPAPQPLSTAYIDDEYFNRLKANPTAKRIGGGHW